MPFKPKSARFTLKRKGRYLLLALALFGAYQATGGERAPKTETLARAVTPPAPSCLRTPELPDAPPPPAALSGRLGLYVARLDPLTLQPVRAVARDPDGVYPLASSYKQAVLWALLRQVDAGRVSLSEKFDVTHGSQSLGNYPFDGSDVTTLATRMIHNSDNTATDILHRRVGLEAVQEVADALQLCHTRLLLPTKDWWVAQSGLDPAWPGAPTFASLTPGKRDEVARTLDAAAQNVRADVLQRALDRYFEERYDAGADLGTHNVSTPYEFGTLIAHEFLKSGLSEKSQLLQRQIMGSGFGRTQLHAPLAFFGGKGGNGWKILTMTGYFETPQGEHVVYVFMQHGSHEDYTLRNTRTAFRWINAAVDEVLSDQDAALQAGGKP